jgi:hypothetical protein
MGSNDTMKPTIGRHGLRSAEFFDLTFFMILCERVLV